VVDRRTVLAAAGAGVLAALAGCGTRRPTRSDAGLVRAQLAPVAATAADSAAGAAVVKRLAAHTSGSVFAGDGNVIYSPVSIAVALGMLRAGVTGVSARQLDRLSGLPGNALPAAISGLDRTLDSLSRQTKLADGSRMTVQVDIANALWGQRGLTWQQPFLDTLARYYDTGMRVVDYEHAAAAARRAVNGWVDERTHGKITELIGPGVFDGDTRLTLVNALYLKAPWALPFSAAGHHPFHTPTGSVSVPTMRAALTTSCRQTATWQSATVPYFGNDVAMTLILPRSSKPSAVLAELAAGTLLPAVTRPAGKQPVELQMPRFEVFTGLPLKPVLADVGVTAPFDPRTHDLRPMTHEQDLHVDQAVHRATVAVDEHGTEAAAATAVVAGITSVNTQPPLQLTLDRPFLFVLHDTAAGTPLFAGRISDPSTS
jgi:serpin B